MRIDDTEHLGYSEILAEIRSLRESVERLLRKPITPSRVCTIQQAAELLAVSTKTVSRMIAECRLKPVMVGKRQMVPRAQLEALSSETTSAPTPPRPSRARGGYSVFEEVAKIRDLGKRR